MTDLLAVGRCAIKNNRRRTVVNLPKKLTDRIERVFFFWDLNDIFVFEDFQTASLRPIAYGQTELT